LTDEQRRIYVPQVLARLEERIGLEMLPKLSKPQLTQFAKFAESENTTGEQWRDFWYASIPTFEEDLKKIIIAFGEKVSAILSKTA